jgi:hypothetical protein
MPDHLGNVPQRLPALVREPAEVATEQGLADEVFERGELTIEVEQEVPPVQGGVDQLRRVARGDREAVLALGQRAAPGEVRVGPVSRPWRASVLVHEVARATVHGGAGKRPGQRPGRRRRRVQDGITSRKWRVDVTARVRREEPGEARLQKQPLADGYLGGVALDWRGRAAMVATAAVALSGPEVGDGPCGDDRHGNQDDECKEHVNRAHTCLRAGMEPASGGWLRKREDLRWLAR